MKIAVLAKQVPDTYNNRRLDLETGMLDRTASELVPDEISERACEVALQARENLGDAEIIVICMGPTDSESTVRRLLAMGADSGVIITDPALAGSDMVSTSRVLSAALSRVGADLIIGGNESTDGRGGLVPAMVAELMDLPLLPYADQVEISTTEVVGTTQAGNTELSLAVPLPAVISVTEKTAAPRFPNFKGIRAAKKKPLDIWTLSDLGIEAGPEAAYYRNVMVSADERPPRVAGPKVVDDGTAAAQLADFLAAKKFV